MLKILIDIAMYKLIEISHVYSKTSGSLWYRDEPAVDNNNNIYSISLKILQKIKRQTGNGGQKKKMLQ